MLDKIDRAKSEFDWIVRGIEMALNLLIMNLVMDFFYASVALTTRNRNGTKPLNMNLVMDFFFMQV